MKKILLCLLLFPSIAQSQLWLESNGQKDTNAFVYDDWYNIMSDLTEMYCGLYEDSEIWDYSYKKISNREDLIFCKFTNKSDSSYQIGYQRLFEVEKGKYCWKLDVFWFWFNAKGILLEEIFFNDGKLIKPKEFEVIVDYGN